MNPFLIILLTHSSIAPLPGLGSVYILALIVSGASVFRGILWSHSLLGENRDASCSENTLACIWYSSGIVASVLTFS
jgi:hypothetical protein